MCGSAKENRESNKINGTHNEGILINRKFNLQKTRIQQEIPFSHFSAENYHRAYSLTILLPGQTSAISSILHPIYKTKHFHECRSNDGIHDIFGFQPQQQKNEKEKRKTRKLPGITFKNMLMKFYGCFAMESISLCVHFWLAKDIHGYDRFFFVELVIFHHYSVNSMVCM